MNSTIGNSSSTIDIPAVTSKSDSSRHTHQKRAVASTYSPTASAAGNSTFLSADGPTLLHFRAQSILSLLVEDSDANRCGKEVVHRWNYFHN